MTAHAYASPTARETEPQPRLFALPGGATDSPQRPVARGVAPLAPVPSRAELPGPATVAAAALALAPAPAPAQARPALVPVGEPVRSTRTLDSELRLAWTAITAGAPAACFMCGGRMEPLAHAPGGACTSCGTTLE